ncbi:MAG: hypothetical protein M1837_003338 [Sclerophora amabilis]|nr:MAG: hypothetical protein M1837_003338 [Sclerophora amabilis]
MDVDLYIYDLSKGLARQYSGAFLGVHIDAVYHTAIVMDGVEYFFGAGIQTCAPPGATHHGRPLEILRLGTTSLPRDIIATYLQTLGESYSAESYDLFLHNCNNFTNDLAEFLVGRGIPDRIQSLPRRVLETPFGAMMKEQIDAAMRPVVQQSSHPALYPSATNAQSPPRQVHVSHPHRTMKFQALESACRDPITFPELTPPSTSMFTFSDVGQDQAINALKHFVSESTAHKDQSALPDLNALGFYIRRAVHDLPQERLFNILTYLCAAMMDPRVSGYYAADNDQETVRCLVRHIDQLGNDCSAHLRLVTLRITCNLFTSPITSQLVKRQEGFRTSITDLTCNSLTKSGVGEIIRLAASGAAFNITSSVYEQRREDGACSLSSDEVLGLTSALLYAIDAEETSSVVLRRCVLALGFLTHLRPLENDDIWEFLQLSNATDTVTGKAARFPQEEKLTIEIGRDLLDIHDR